MLVTGQARGITGKTGEPAAIDQRTRNSGEF